MGPPQHASESTPATTAVCVPGCFLRSEHGGGRCGHGMPRRWHLADWRAPKLLSALAAIPGPKLCSL